MTHLRRIPALTKARKLAFQFQNYSDRLKHQLVQLQLVINSIVQSRKLIFEETISFQQKKFVFVIEFNHLSNEKAIGIMQMDLLAPGRKHRR